MGSKTSEFPDFQTRPPDELSDPNLTPLPTHPRIKYVARALAATNIVAAEKEHTVASQTNAPVIIKVQTLDLVDGFRVLEDALHCHRMVKDSLDGQTLPKGILDI